MLFHYINYKALKTHHGDTGVLQNLAMQFKAKNWITKETIKYHMPVVVQTCQGNCLAKTPWELESQIYLGWIPKQTCHTIPVSLLNSHYVHCKRKHVHLQSYFIHYGRNAMCCLYNTWLAGITTDFYYKLIEIGCQALFGTSHIWGILAS